MEVEKPQYTNDELTAMLNQQISLNVAMGMALAEAVKHLPEHAKNLVADALRGGE